MIRSLNLDPMFVPVTAPEIEFDSFVFNGGEMHIRLNNRIDYINVDKVVVTHRIKNSDDIMLLLLATDALNKYGIDNMDLIIPYVPYARQDRICNTGEAFSLEVFSKLINSLGFRKVFVVDPHSDQVKKYISNCYPLQVTDYVEDILSVLPNETVLVAPDAGAFNRVCKIAGQLRKNFMQCSKVRDPETGKLLSFESNLPKEHIGKPLLIVDDICDGGGTFLGLADALKKDGAGDLYLYVTHGIFSAGFMALWSKFQHIFTTNSFNTIGDIQDEPLTQFNLRI